MRAATLADRVVRKVNENAEEKRRGGEEVWLRGGVDGTTRLDPSPSKASGSAQVDEGEIQESHLSPAAPPGTQTAD